MLTLEFGNFLCVRTFHTPSGILRNLKLYARPRTQADVVRHTKYYQRYLRLAKEDKYLTPGIVVAEHNGQITIYEH